MKNLKKTLEVEIVEVVFSNVVDYFANSITSTEFINKILRPLTSVSEEQEEKISDILSEYNREWSDADCDAEGATQEQNKKLDRIIEDAAFSIAELF